MAKKPIPERVQIKTSLTAGQVNAYWRELNMAEETWMNNFSLAQRYELVISDLLNKLNRDRQLLEESRNIDIPE